MSLAAGLAASPPWASWMGWECSDRSPVPWPALRDPRSIPDKINQPTNQLTMEVILTISPSNQFTAGDISAVKAAADSRGMTAEEFVVAAVAAALENQPENN